MLSGTRIDYLANGKPFKMLGLGYGYKTDVIDLCPARSVTQPCFHGIDFFCCAANTGFDAAVGAIADPAPQSESLSFSPGVVAKADTLHAASN